MATENMEPIRKPRFAASSLSMCGNVLQSKGAGVAIVAILAIAGTAVRAADIRAAAELAIGHSDNIARTGADERSETISSAGFDLTATERSRRLTADLISSFDYQHYYAGSYDDETVGFVTGNATLSLLPERLTWMAQDNFGQTRLDIFSTPTPDNRENINYFTTGPDLVLSSSPNLGVRLSGRYSLVDYEITPYDNSRIAGMATLGRSLGGSSELSLNIVSQDTRFDRQYSSADYRTQQAYAEYSATGARTTVLVNVGASEYVRGGLVDSGALLRLSVERQIARRTTLTLRLGREISDSAEALRFQQTLDYFGRETLALGLAGAAYEQNLGALSVNVSGLRTQLGLSISRTSDEYVGSATQDRRRTVAEVHVTRTLGSQLSVNGSFSHTNDKYVNSNGRLTERLARVGLNWRMRRLLALELLAERYDHRGVVASTAVEESRAWLRIRFGDPFAGQRPVGVFTSDGSDPR